MNLTDEQKLEMTETIARAAFGLKGMRCLTHTDGSRNIWVLPKGGDWKPFNPFADWNDAIRARDKLLALADYSVTYVHYHTDDPWVQVEITIWIHPDCGLDLVYEGRGASELEALVMAMHEIAKARLEANQ